MHFYKNLTADYFDKVEFDLEADKSALKSV